MNKWEPSDQMQVYCLPSVGSEDPWSLVSVVDHDVSPTRLGSLSCQFDHSPMGRVDGGTEVSYLDSHG